MNINTNLQIGNQKPDWTITFAACELKKEKYPSIICVARWWKEESVRNDGKWSQKHTGRTKWEERCGYNQWPIRVCVTVWARHSWQAQINPVGMLQKYVCTRRMVWNQIFRHACRYRQCHLGVSLQAPLFVVASSRMRCIIWIISGGGAVRAKMSKMYSLFNVPSVKLCKICRRHVQRIQQGRAVNQGLQRSIKTFQSRPVRHDYLATVHAYHSCIFWYYFQALLFKNMSRNIFRFIVYDLWGL